MSIPANLVTTLQEDSALFGDPDWVIKKLFGGTQFNLFCEYGEIKHMIHFLLSVCLHIFTLDFMWVLVGQTLSKEAHILTSCHVK